MVVEHEQEQLPSLTLTAITSSTSSRWTQWALRYILLTESVDDDDGETGRKRRRSCERNRQERCSRRIIWVFVARRNYGTLIYCNPLHSPLIKHERTSVARLLLLPTHTFTLVHIFYIPCQHPPLCTSRGDVGHTRNMAWNSYVNPSRYLMYERSHIVSLWLELLVRCGTHSSRRPDDGNPEWLYAREQGARIGCYGVPSEWRAMHGWLGG